MKRFNHMYDIAFSLTSYREDASDVTPADLRAALLDRIHSMSDADWVEAVGLCDTYEEDAA